MRRKTFSIKRRGKLLPVLGLFALSSVLMSSSHREAPLIANDPLADNTDLYAFRSPDNPNKITIIANYVPLQLPYGGPNYNNFGENIRYEIHIDNNLNTKGDDIIYRFTFNQKNEDPTTFFNIRLGKQNLKTTYRLQRSTDGGRHFVTIVSRGIVPPPNIGPRSISGAAGLNVADYNTLMTKAIANAYTGEKVFCGPVDDAFFVDLGGIFDLGDAPRTTGSKPTDGVQCKNVSAIALQIDISTLQKHHKPVSKAKNILDPDYVIGVWASASRPKIRILRDITNDYDRDGNLRTANTDRFWQDDAEFTFGPWVQVSRLGMPLTNEAVVPIGYKDLWNALTPYEDLEKLKIFGKFFYNPELALYMDDNFFGGAVPALKPLRIQRNSLGAFGFGNNQNGLYGLKGSAAVAGTALDDAVFGKLLLPAPKSPRSVDLWPIFHTGVPNLKPYQLATGKAGNPLASGKPFIHNFLPNGGDMLRLNMAVPATKRDDPAFSPLGLVQAAVLGLTDPAYNSNANLQFIPNMDGFPNGRRLEDDVTLIELQAVSGIVLAAVGLWYDDFDGTNPVTPNLLSVLTYRTGVNANDTTFKPSFPYLQTPWSGVSACCGFPFKDASGDKSGEKSADMTIPNTKTGGLNIKTPDVFMTATPNPIANNNTIRYHLAAPSKITLAVYDSKGQQVQVLLNKQQDAGTYTYEWNSSKLASGVYFVNAAVNGNIKQTIRLVKGK
ncbi:DUF4331 family protein [Foetidibacter luteolus]|uniref:DUF4331 family protein n=1 Tax=Foetidibacter luteolus TaxID=2608880 RepID=UPI00129BD119|nr:DUF4331 family protein [Foetidibacter luteolus]